MGVEGYGVSLKRGNYDVESAQHRSLRPRDASRLKIQGGFDGTLNCQNPTANFKAKTLMNKQQIKGRSKCE